MKVLLSRVPRREDRAEWAHLATHHLQSAGLERVHFVATFTEFHRRVVIFAAPPIARALARMRRAAGEWREQHKDAHDGPI